MQASMNILHKCTESADDDELGDGNGVDDYDEDDNGGDGVDVAAAHQHFLPTLLSQREG